MIISTLALLISLTLPASAESADAAFTSALSEIRNAATTMVKHGNHLSKRPEQKAPPAPASPSANDAVWQKVVEAVKKDGKYKPGGPQTPARFTLEDVSGNPKADRTMRGISFLGMLNNEEQFQALGAIIVSMDHKLDAKTGNFTVDMWMFEVDVYGAVQDVSHGTMIQTPAGKPLSTTRDTTGPTDPASKTQYDAQLKFWSERSVK